MKNLLSLFIFALVLIACSSDDNANIQPIENPAIEAVTNVAVTEDLDGFLGVDDIITYTISVKNTGDVSLSGISINNAFTDLEGNSLSLTSEPNFVSADAGSDEGNLQVDETATYSATYTITQSDVDAGGLSFSTTANGTSPEGESVSDVSDNGDDSDGNTNDDATETALTEPPVDPTIIAEFHTMNSAGSIALRYKFDINGRISSVIDGANKYYFEFDTDQKLTNIRRTDLDDNIVDSDDIIYDGANRVVSIGDTSYDYNDVENYYILSTPFQGATYTDGDYEFTDFNTVIYTVIPDNPILNNCEYYYQECTNTTTGEMSICAEFCTYTYWTGYENNNVTSENDDDGSIINEYDTDINPLFGNTNLINLFEFLRYKFNLSLRWGIDILFSQNNKIRITVPPEPWQLIQVYDFNSNNLPTTRNAQYWDTGVPGEVWVSAKYYYQGDEIPE